MNSIKKFLFFALFSVGCAASDNYGYDFSTESDAGVDAGGTVDEPVADEAVALGTLEQALTLPSGYGINNQLRCGSTWTGNCYVPQDKKIRLKFFASTCAGDWAKTRFVEAMDVFIGWMNSRGWTIQGPDSQDRYDYALKCDETPYDPNGGMPIGSFLHPSSGDGTSCFYVSGKGTLCKFTKGTLWINTAIAMDKLYDFSGEAAKREAYRNYLLHELGHSVGLGHYGTDGSDLMAIHGSGADGIYTDTFSTVEFNMLQNYAP
jgi:hypothetical protein